MSETELHLLKRGKPVRHGASWRLAATLLLAAAAAGRAHSQMPVPPRDSGASCTSCLFGQSAVAYARAAERVVGAWHDYYAGMQAYEMCMATNLSADSGRCADPPHQPAGSPCADPTVKGVALCNATIPPDRPGAEFVALPDSLTSIDLRQSAFTSAGAVRYVWDALSAQQELAPALKARDRAAVARRRRTTDSLLAVIEAQAAPPPADETAFHLALDAGIVRLNRAAVSDDPDEYLDALRFIALADSVHPSPQAKFVMGLITYQIGEHALLAAWQIHNCSVVLLAADAIMKSDRYLGQNSVVAPENAIHLRQSLALMRKDATTLVTRRCL